MSGTRVGVMAGVAWDTGLPAATTITGSMDTSCRPGIYTVSIHYLYSFYTVSTQVLGARAWCWW